MTEAERKRALMRSLLGGTDQANPPSEVQPDQPIEGQPEADRKRQLMRQYIQATTPAPKASATATIGMGQGGKTPLGFFSRALEAVGIAPWNAISNLSEADDGQNTGQRMTTTGNPAEILGSWLRRLGPKRTKASLAKTAADMRGFVTGDTTEIPGATEALFLPEYRDSGLAKGAGFVAEAATNPVNYVPFAKGAKTLNAGLNAATTVAAGSEVATQINNARRNEPVNLFNAGLGTALTALPVIRGLAPNVSRRLSNVGTTRNLPPNAQKALEIVNAAEAVKSERLQKVLPVLSEVAKQADTEAVQAGGRERLAKRLDILGRREASRARIRAAQQETAAQAVAQGDPFGLPPQVQNRADAIRSALASGDQVAPQAAQQAAQTVDYSDLRTGATLQETIKNITDSLYQRAGQVGLPEFAYRQGYFPRVAVRPGSPLAAGNTVLERTRDLGRRIFGRAPETAPTNAVGAATNPVKGFMKTRTAETVRQFERGAQAQGLVPIWDPVKNLSNRITAQLDAEKAQEIVQGLAEAGLALGKDQAPREWVDLGTVLAKQITKAQPGQAAQQVLRILENVKVDPDAARALVNVLTPTDPSTGFLAAIDALQGGYRTGVFLNPFDVIKRGGALADQVGLPPTEIAGAVTGAMKEAVTGRRIPTFQEFIRQGVSRSQVSNAAEAALAAERAAGTAEGGVRLAQRLPFLPVSGGFNEAFDQGVMERLKRTAYEKLVSEGTSADEAAAIVGQAFSNPNLLRELFGADGAAIANRLAFTPNYWMRNVGFQLRQAANNPSRTFAQMYQFPATAQRAMMGTETGDNPPGQQGRIALGPPDDEGVQRFLNPTLPARELPQAMESGLIGNPWPFSYVTSRLAPLPRLVSRAAERSDDERIEAYSLPLPPILKQKRDESREVPMFGTGYYGIGPNVSPRTQEVIRSVIPLLPRYADSAAKETLLRDLFLELFGMNLGHKNVNAAKLGQQYTIQRAKSEIRSNLRKRAEANQQK